MAKNNEQNQDLANKIVKLYDKKPKPKKLKGKALRRHKAEQRKKFLEAKNKAKEAKPKGITATLNELRREYKKHKKLYGKASTAQRLSPDGKKLKEYIAALAKDIKQIEEDVEKDRVALVMFEHNGIWVRKPSGGYTVIDEELNLIADASIKSSLPLDRKILESNAANGDFLVVFNRVDTNEFKYAAITVTADSILKAREQRLQLAYLGGDQAVADLIKRGLEGKIDKRLKDPAKIIKKHTEDFLSVFSFPVILRDIERLVNNL